MYSPLLWEESEDFARARSDSGTPVRLAAFRIAFSDAVPGELHKERRTIYYAPLTQVIEEGKSQEG